MMLVVSVLTVLALYFAQRNVAAAAERDLQANFQAEISSLHKMQALRRATLTERCRELVLNPRLHAALEDNALELLYPSAKDELRDLMENAAPLQPEGANLFHAKFYRFLDSSGAILPPPNPNEVGRLSREAEGQLALKRLPNAQQIGYVVELADAAAGAIYEVMAVPIHSTETGEVISALIVGFEAFEVVDKRAETGLKSGIWVNGHLHLPSLSKAAQLSIGDEIAKAVDQDDSRQNNFSVTVDGIPHLLFYRSLNPGSIFPPAYEICVYPLAKYIVQQHRLSWQIGGAGALLLFAGFVASNFVAARLSRPVEKLAVDSEMNRAERRRAEAALASTSEELKRSARYSADASHQLKSPVTVLRVGLEKLLGREDFKAEVYHELSGLLHQTYRITGVIDDLLLLSRLDAGHLQIESKPVNLSRLIEEWLEDLNALAESPDVKIEKNFASELYVAGEKRYTSLIVQNLLENARKYNRPGGRIQVTAETEEGKVSLTIGNTGRPIPRNAQKYIFERFHRGGTGSHVSGHGLGLNLARELARLHGGDLRLVRSDNDWTEFEVRFRVAHPTLASVAEVA
jgi:signal transduction histidine kinase